jgi:hypothetical protein
MQEQDETVDISPPAMTPTPRSSAYVYNAQGDNDVVSEGVKTRYLKYEVLRVCVCESVSEMVRETEREVVCRWKLCWVSCILPRNRKHIL